MLLIPFTKTLFNEFETHFLLYISVLSNSEVIPLTQTWLHYAFLINEGPRRQYQDPAKAEVPHREKQKLKLVGLF